MSSHNDEEVGVSGRIKMAMAAQRMTMKALSDSAGVPYRTLQNYLLEKHAAPADALAKIADALNVSVDWLISGKPARLDAGLVARSLSLIEDVRVLGKHKTPFSECAGMFINFYQKLFAERLLSTGRARGRVEEEVHRGEP